MKRTPALFVLGALAAAAALTSCGGSSSSSSYCSRISAYLDKADKFGVSMSTSTPAQLKTAFEGIQAELHSMQQGVPAEIAPDVKVMVDTMDQLVALFAKDGYDMNRLGASGDAAQIDTIFSNASVKTASDHLAKYSSDVCHIAGATTTTTG